MNLCAIIIPIYKTVLNQYELASFKQVLRVLDQYPLYIITHNKLDISEYLKVSKQIRVEFFDEFYFSSIYGYNNLCLTYNFYSRFSNYKYMLIYQLDAYVFYDNLEYWCNKGYDYIGAPWFKDFGTHEEGKELWEVGNGGFSLRKVDYFLKLLSYRHPLSKRLDKKNGTKAFIKSLAKRLGYHSTINWYISQNLSTNEDLFYSVYLNNIIELNDLKIKKPSISEAMYFSFEKSPSYLYNICKKLPFGCHAFQKNEYEKFWQQFIK